jgi:PTH1 family peptidyl-tRNA hydrolase
VKLVAGLGNPGKRYERTRHNLGFSVVDYIARQIDVRVTSKRGNSLIAESSWHGEKLVLAKPQAYMNRSGDSVKALMREFGAGAEELIVVYDDLDLPFGRIRIRPSGSAGGHRGVASIIDSLAGAPFYRVRMGIGRPPDGVDPAEYVLEPFSPEEALQVGAIVERAAKAVLSLIEHGGPASMGHFNRAL